jgi:uncharacterized membrane protein
MQANDIADSFGIRAYPVRQVPLDAPWAWLAKGWRDLLRVPQVSLLYGLVPVAVAALILWGLTKFGAQSLMIVFSAGFLLVSPMLAVGLYEVSRRLEAGEPIELRRILLVSTESPGQLVFFGVLLGFIFLVWVDLAIFILAMFYGPQPFPPLDAFASTLLLTWFGLSMLVVGTVVGGVLAALVFSATVVSIPLLMTRELNAVTAMAVSLQAVSENAKPLALWAGLIAGLTALGFLAGLVGLALVFTPSHPRELARLPRPRRRRAAPADAGAGPARLIGPEPGRSLRESSCEIACLGPPRRPGDPARPGRAGGEPPGSRRRRRVHPAPDRTADRPEGARQAVEAEALRRA